MVHERDARVSVPRWLRYPGFASWLLVGNGLRGSDHRPVIEGVPVASG